MPSLASLVPILAPFIALAGVIWLYFRKLADDRSEARRKERMDLYSDVLAQANLVWSLITAGPPFKDATMESVKFRLRLHRLNLLAPPEVYAAAIDLHDALDAFTSAGLEYGLGHWRDAVDAGLLQPHVETITKREEVLLQAMRADIDPPAPPRRRPPDWQSLRIQTLTALSARLPKKPPPPPQDPTP